MGVTLRISGEDPLLSALHSFSNPASHKNLMETLCSAGVASTEQRFISSRSPDGPKWAPIQRAGQVLRDSGRLYKSLSWKATPHSAEWGTNVIYAAIHQFGGIIKPRSAKRLVFKGLRGMVSAMKVEIKARPYLGINREDRDEFEALIQDWMRRPFGA